MDLYILIIFTCLFETAVPFQIFRSELFYLSMVDFNSSHKIIATKHNDNLLHCLAECLTISHCGGVRFSKEQHLCVLLELYSENDSAAVTNNAKRWTENVVTWFKTVEQKGNNLERKEVVKLSETE